LQLRASIWNINSYVVRSSAGWLVCGSISIRLHIWCYSRILTRSRYWLWYIFCLILLWRANNWNVKSCVGWYSASWLVWSSISVRLHQWYYSSVLARCRYYLRYICRGILQLRASIWNIKSYVVRSSAGRLVYGRISNTHCSLEIHRRILARWIQILWCILSRILLWRTGIWNVKC